jgi:hypothetical protein
MNNMTGLAGEFLPAGEYGARPSWHYLYRPGYRTEMAKKANQGCSEDKSAGFNRYTRTNLAGYVILDKAV